MTVIIEGVQGEGKTAVASVIMRALRDAGCKIPYNWRSEVDEFMGDQDAKAILERINPTVEIEIKLTGENT